MAAASSSSSSSSPSPSPSPSSSDPPEKGTVACMYKVPVIDLALPDEAIVPLIAQACATFGFFQITHHGLEPSLPSFSSAMAEYFSLPYSEKMQDKRNQQNARGYFDDELTKQKRDWKECLDVGMPASRDWFGVADDAPENTCLDGYNVFPSKALLPSFRTTIVNYFDECATLSNRLATLMARGLEMVSGNKEFLDELAASHTSYLRLNYYPPCEDEEKKESEGILGVSPHRDAGFLTILLQDEDCHSLQVWLEAAQEWITIHPLPNALTINTGDMCMLWSNGRYQAPLHRVLTSPNRKRYSAPFFYNPGYHQWIQAPDGASLKDTDGATIDEKRDDKYHPCLYGYFRAVRFAGDLTDLGVEIQVQDYDREGRDSSHLAKQKLFAEQVDFSQPFSVETYRPLLVSSSSSPENDEVEQQKA